MKKKVPLQEVVIGKAKYMREICAYFTSLKRANEIHPQQVKHALEQLPPALSVRGIGPFTIPPPLGHAGRRERRETRPSPD